MIAQPPTGRTRPPTEPLLDLDQPLERLQTFAKKDHKTGVVRDPDGTNIRPVTLRSYKDARAAKNRVARKQRKTNSKKK